MFVIPLEKISSKDSYIAGNKATTLGEIQKLGINVPRGFVVSSQTFDTFLNHNEITSDIFEILSKQDEDIKTKSNKLKNLILQGTIPVEIEKEIILEYRKNPKRNFIVRSSSLIEDNLKNSWAGQMESFPIASERELIQGIKNCWASAFSQHTLQYRYSSKLRKKPISVAILVQEMLSPQVAGIGFSAHPTTNENQIIFIEAGLGHGKGIVSGKVSPDKYIVNKENNFLHDIYIPTQKKKIVFIKGKEKEIILPKYIGSKKFLSHNEIKKLSQHIKSIENHFGYKVDIEWAKDKTGIYILQTRPITKLKSPKKTRSHIKIFHKPLLALSVMEIWYRGELNENDNSDPLFIYNPRNGIGVYYDKNSIKSNLPEMAENYKLIIYEDLKEFLIECKNINEIVMRKNPNEILLVLEKLEKIWPKINNLYLFLLGVEKGIFVPKKIKLYAEKMRIISEKVSHNAFDFILNYTEKFLTNKPNKYFYLSDFLTIAEIRKEKFKKYSPKIFSKINKKEGYVYYRGKIYVRKEMRDIIKNKITKNISFLTKTENNLSGFPVYFQKTTKGKVRKILNFNKLSNFENNEIIVVQSLSPEYTSLIKNISGIITEEGGELSHASILAREYKIPCIVGVENATKILQNGQMIEIGKNGVIKIL